MHRARTRARYTGVSTPYDARHHHAFGRRDDRPRALTPRSVGTPKGCFVARRSWSRQNDFTFTLIHEYRGPNANLFHIDLYRIDTQRELDTLALDDLLSEKSILLIEWGEKFPRFERERDVEIALERVSEDERRIRITEP